MDILEKFIRKVAYKFPKGYPDINSPEDRALLFELVGYESLLESTYNNFSFGDINKPGREYRAEVIADKIAKGEEFQMTGDISRKLEFTDPKYAELFSNQDLEAIKQEGGSRVNKFPFFVDKATGTKYSLQDLLKTPELGGKGKGSGTAVEDAALSSLSKAVQQAVEESGGPITVVVGNTQYRNIAGVKTQPGFPKSDFNLINASGEPVVFISHKKAAKKGAGPGDFIRWGGFTEFKDYPDVQQFITKLKSFLEKNGLDRMPNATNFIKEIQDDELAKKLVYGPDYGKDFGVNNVQIAIQGEVMLKKLKDGIYSLVGQHQYLNGENPEGDYRPILVGKYRSDRAMFGIPSLEAIAQPGAIAHSASNIYELKKDEFVKIK